MTDAWSRRVRPRELKAQAGGETLDDVFLALTGHAATPDDHDADSTTTLEETIR